MKTNKVVQLAGYVVLAAGISAGTASAQTKSTSDTYLDKCAICHGADGAGKTARGRKLKVQDVRQTSTKMSVEQMIEIVAKGKAPDMDGFAKELTPEQIKEVVDYYRSLAKK